MTARDGSPDLDRWLSAAGYVGREVEQITMARLLAMSRRGMGRVVLVGGEAGAGKTRLAEETAANAEARGFAVAWGYCRESASAPPLWPWWQVLGGLGLPLPDEESADPAARFRLFEAVAIAVARCSGERPLLIVLDDVHRADAASLALLRFAVDQWRRAAVAVVATFRELDPLSGVAGSGVERLLLGGLTVGDVACWLDLAGVRADATALQARTLGNPLFVGEVIGYLRAGGSADGMPSTLRQLILERVRALPDVTGRVLEVAAVIGRRFDTALLAETVGSSEMEVLECMRAATEARIVIDDQSEMMFVHALVQEAIAGSLPRPRRVELHVQVLGALDRLGGSPTDVAYHALAARPAIGGLELAARIAAAALAADRALAYEDAAELWRAAGDLEPADQRIGLRRARSLLLAGHVSDARAQFEAVAVGARLAGDDGLLAQAALGLGETVAEVAPDGALIAGLDDALSRPAVAAGDRVRLLARRAMAAYWVPGRQDEARMRAADALSAGRVCDDRRALGSALAARHFMLRGPDLLDERLKTGEAVCAIGRELDDDDLCFRGHQWLVPDLVHAGDIDAAVAHLQAAATIAEARRDPLKRWWTLVLHGLIATFQGDDDAEAVVDEAFALGRRLGQQAADAYHAGQLTLLHWRHGRLDEILALLRDTAQRFPGLPTLECDLALAAAATGRAEEATAIVRALSAEDFARLPRDSLYLASLAILSEVAFALDDPQPAPALRTALLPYAERNLVQGVPVAWGAGAFHLARLDHLLNDEDSARKHAAHAEALHRTWLASQWGAALRGEHSADAGLTRREREVLGHLARGQSNKEIAAAMVLSVHTVERHVANIFAKLGISNRAAAAVWAQRNRLVN
jgi:DNA-binding CsgD family transcriptional regulator/RecA/RadA recombinase